MGAVPAVASWRLAALPRGLQASEIERLLAGCRRETAVGLRDFAVLSLLARLGLRGAEAAGRQVAKVLPETTGPMMVFATVRLSVKCVQRPGRPDHGSPPALPRRADLVDGRVRA